MEAKENKIYVGVVAGFDPYGRILPREILWEDGQVFPIDRVLDIRPAPALKAGGQGDRYTIRIRGKNRYLFFEHNPEIDSSNLGRWFIERGSP